MEETFSLGCKQCLQYCTYCIRILYTTTKGGEKFPFLLLCKHFCRIIRDLVIIQYSCRVHFYVYLRPREKIQEKVIKHRDDNGFVHDLSQKWNKKVMRMIKISWPNVRGHKINEHHKVKFLKKIDLFVWFDCLSLSIDAWKMSFLLIQFT